VAWKIGKKIASGALVLSMLGTGWGGIASAAGAGPHWAQDTLNAWVEKGWLAGANGSLLPDQPITRAEFAALAVRSFGLKAQGAARFSDVRDGSWYAGAIYAAVGEGVLTGYPDGTIRPAGQVTRQEAAVMLAKLDGLPVSESGEPSFADAADIRSWSKPSVGAAVYSKLLGGYPDGTFKPARSLTRAEAVVALDKAWTLHERSRTTVFDKAGIYGPAEGTQEIVGNVVISAPGVTLRNTVVRGDLAIGAEVGEGDAQLEHVTVGGTLNVAGGGEHSVHLSNAVLGQVIVNKPGGKLRIVLEGNTSVEKLEFRTAGLLIVPVGTSVGSLTAYAIIYVTGSGKIGVARLLVSGSSFEHAPDSIERAAGVLLAGESGSGGSSSGTGGPTPTPAPSATPTPSATPSTEPSPSPSAEPSPSPSTSPSPSPSTEPSPSPSAEPSPSPSAEPSPSPSAEPSPSPSPSPSAEPSPSPTPSPSAEPTPSPTPGPVIAGVEDGKVYTASVTPALGEGETFESVVLTKDGAPVEGFELGDELYETGSYVLTATNAAGGETVIHFTLSADVQLTTNFYQYYKFDGELRVQVNVANQGLDLENAVNGIELTLPDYNGDELDVYYWYGEVYDSFTLERIEGTDRFVGHYPQDPYSLPNGAEFDITYSVDIDTSTTNRDMLLKAWVADASAPDEKDALFKLAPLNIHADYDKIGPVNDLAIDPSGEGDGSQIRLTFTEPLDYDGRWIYAIIDNDVVRWSDQDLVWGEGSVLVKNLNEGVDYKLQLIVNGGYNAGESNIVEYTPISLPPLEPAE